MNELREETKKWYRDGILTTEIRWVDEKNHLKLNKNGYAFSIAKLNKKTNITETCFYNTESELIDSSVLHYSKTVEVKINTDYYEIAFFNSKDEPVVNNQGVHKIIRKTESQLCEFSAYDVDGKLTQSSDYNCGYALERYEYDSMGNEILHEMFDKNMKPMNDPCGVAKEVHRYKDDHPDKRIYSAFYDKDGNPVCSIEGYAKYEADYADDDTLITRLYERTYDEKGIVIQDFPVPYTFRKKRWR